MALTPPWQCLNSEASMPANDYGWVKPPIDDDAVFLFGINAQRREKRWPEIGRPEPREYA